VDLLYTEDILRTDFVDARIQQLEKCRIALDESDAHRGEAAVVRLVATQR
jgi:hypothetical protein